MSGIHGKNAMMYLNGEWVPVTLHGVSWFQPILDANDLRPPPCEHSLVVDVRCLWCAVRVEPVGLDLTDPLAVAVRMPDGTSIPAPPHRMTAQPFHRIATRPPARQ